jgi:predicted NBD/HSP70 family sugar kinase
MKTALKIGALLFTLSAVGALAQEKKPTTTTTMTGQQAMAYAKKMDAQERQSMMEQAKQIDAQIAQLQTQVKSLMQRLSQQPKYFDNPTEDKLRP